MKVTAQHYQQVPRLELLIDALSKKQTELLEQLLAVVHREGQSAGYRIGNPNYDED